ncbi:helix-turn-helix domain-containing protein [Ornithinimicrobium humiphilum]|uniref:AraC family transcriptional regulator with amidase-like domain n=1 Tax=Ornithinimicrobium humiphilum TaxID=125288 RepID=A0A543KLH9_9MICO|nr:helix-turn-helix domain-containing protein [Ornithinimicrobium humiphilum]TQM95949.1 AraC family transcriptional regulator with amidase-like domain [Ornithinimicrobium humiphilum]
MPLSTVAVLVRERASLFELGVTAEVFGIDRTAAGLPAIDYRVCAASGPGPVDTKHRSGLSVTATHGLDGLEGADLVVVSATLPHPATAAELEALRAAHAAGAVVLALCSGAFLVAEAGLLSGRRATTHWLYADDLAAAHPDVDVTADEIYIDLGDVVTTAGTGAAVDACLHLVRRELGSTAAATIARRMVAPPQRHGGQLQYVPRPVAPSPATGLAQTLDWAAAHLDEPLDVAALARHAGMSSRQLTRRFLEEVGTTPLRWVTAQRIRLAQELLEQTDLSIERISARVGYGSATQLREHFRRQVGSTPARYRDTFRAAS